MSVIFHLFESEGWKNYSIDSCVASLSEMNA